MDLKWEEDSPKKGGAAVAERKGRECSEARMIRNLDEKVKL